MEISRVLRLDVLTGSLVTWEAWKARHPDTLVLDQLRKRDDPYRGYYASGSAGVIGREVVDERYTTKEFVLGVEAGGAALAFPFRHLSGQTVVNEHLGDHPIVAVFDPHGATGYVFLREVDGRSVTFESIEGDMPLMRDMETGTVWDSVSGEALEGELAGASLERLPAFTSFWFAWTDYYPDGDVWEPGD